MYNFLGSTTLFSGEMSHRIERELFRGGAIAGQINRPDSSRVPTIMALPEVLNIRIPVASPTNE